METSGEATAGGPTDEPEPRPLRELDQTRVARAGYLMQVIGSVRTFTGARVELELFVQRMDAVHAQIKESPFDVQTDANIMGYFFSRMDLAVMLEIGASFSSSWEDVKRALKERYGGAKSSVPRTALRTIETRRENGEGIAAFAGRFGEATRQLKAKVADTYADPTEVKWRVKIYEELATEVLMRAVPEKVKTLLRITKPASLEETVALIKEEELEFRDNIRERRSTTEGDWERVERRRPRPPPRERSPPKGRGPPPRSDRRPLGSGSGLARRTGDTKRRPAREWRPACWECGTEGHFARECPYIFRRHRTERPRYVETTRVEPMQVNACEAREQATRARSQNDSSSESLSERSDTEGYDSRGSGRGRRGHCRRRTTPKSIQSEVKVKGE